MKEKLRIKIFFFIFKAKLTESQYSRPSCHQYLTSWELSESREEVVGSSQLMDSFQALIHSSVFGGGTVCES